MSLELMSATARQATGDTALIFSQAYTQSSNRVHKVRNEHEQVAERIRTDSRVTILERTNLRHVRLAELPGQARVDMATLDLSFISLLKVLPALDGLLAAKAELVTLVKPQFEAERHQVDLQAPVGQLLLCDVAL